MASLIGIELDRKTLLTGAAIVGVALVAYVGWQYVQAHQAAANANNQAESDAQQAQQVADTLASQEEIGLLSQSLVGTSTTANGATVVGAITNSPLGVGTVSGSSGNTSTTVGSGNSAGTQSNPSLLTAPGANTVPGGGYVAPNSSPFGNFVSQNQG